ncbi:MAG: DUF3301 domain-containing protein [Pseudomonadota bacterium]
MWPYLILVLLLTASWFWFDTMKIRELANEVARQGCRRADVQFLDGTVSFAKLSLINSPSGLRFRRVFTFDYSENGENRRQGFIVFVGAQVANLGLQAREIH